VVGDPDMPARVAFDQVDRAAQSNAAIKVDRLGSRMRIGLQSLCIAISKTE
jgi:hypothetical protein